MSYLTDPKPLIIKCNLIKIKKINKDISFSLFDFVLNGCIRMFYNSTPDKMKPTSSSPLGFKSTDEKPCTLDDGQNWKFNLVTQLKQNNTFR